MRQSLAAGATEGIGWFLPYGDHSVMLGLELLGWDWFLGLALLCSAPLFWDNKLRRWLRGLLYFDGGLCLFAVLAFLLGSALLMVGFVAWGLVLFIITGLLVLDFWQGKGVL